MAEKSNFFDSLQIDESDKRILKNKIEESKKCYEFITKPYESSKSNIKLFKDMERAIHNQRYCTITYEENQGAKTYEVKQ